MYTHTLNMHMHTHMQKHLQKEAPEKTNTSNDPLPHNVYQMIFGKQTFSGLFNFNITMHFLCLPLTFTAVSIG